MTDKTNELPPTIAACEKSGIAHNNKAGGQWLLVATDAQLDRLAAALAQPGETQGEPVAPFFYAKRQGDGEWVLCSHADFIFWATRPGWQTTALHSAPPRAAEPVDDERVSEMLRKFSHAVSFGSAAEIKRYGDVIRAAISAPPRAAEPVSPTSVVEPHIPLRDLLRIYDEQNGDWCGIAREVERLTIAALAKPAGEAQPVKAYTALSAHKAVNHLGLESSPGRLAEATAMLVPAQPTPEPAEATELVEAARRVLRAADQGCTYTGDHPIALLRVAVEKAAHQRPSDDDLWDKTLSDRDRYHEAADDLANAIAKHLGVDVGEHSSGNDPWTRALDAIENSTPGAPVGGAASRLAADLRALADDAQMVLTEQALCTLDLAAEALAAATEKAEHPDARLLSIAHRLSMATDEGDDLARGTHYVDAAGRVRCKGSFLALIEDARAAIAASAPAPGAEGKQP